MFKDVVVVVVVAAAEYYLIENYLYYELILIVDQFLNYQLHFNLHY